MDVKIFLSLTLVVAADEFVPGVAGEVAGVAEPEPVPRPLDHSDLVLHAARQRHLGQGRHVSGV